MCRESESIRAVDEAAEALTRTCTAALLHRTFDTTLSEPLPPDFNALLDKIGRRKRRNGGAA